MNRIMNARIVGISAIAILLLTTSVPQGFAWDNGQSNDQGEAQSQTQNQTQDQHQVQGQNQNQNQVQDGNQNQSDDQNQSSTEKQGEDNAGNNGDLHQNQSSTEEQTNNNTDGNGNDENEATSTPPTVTGTSTMTFHFVKVMCPSYGDITGNGIADTQDATNGNYTQFTNYATSAPHFPATYSVKPVSLQEIPSRCVKTSGWQFRLSTDQPQTQDVSVVGPTNANGEYVTTFANLPAALKNDITNGKAIWVRELLQQGSSFGALRCYKDALKGDNSEFIYLGNDRPSDVYCIAYNIANTPVLNATTSSLKVVVNVVNSGHGVKTPADFLIGITGANPSVASFQGSATGTVITLGNGSYAINEATSSLVGYMAAYSSDCSGTLSGGQSKICTITNTNPAPPVPGCSVNGLYGMYFNLPKTLTGMEGPITGIVTGTVPSQFPWFDAKYLSFERNDATSVFNQTSNFFPVNDGLEGDPFYTAIHWTGYISAATSGMYTANYGSDDDMWVYVNNSLVIDNGGIHAFSSLTKQIHLDQGASKIDIYFAERHTVQSGIAFTVNGATLSPCAPTVVPPTTTSTITILPATLPNGTTGVSYAQTLTANVSGTMLTGPFVWNVATGTVPSGLILGTSTNATTSISGTPSTAGTYQFVISVMNGSSSASQAYTVVVSAPTCTTNCGGGGGGNTNPLVLSPITLPNGTVGTAYGQPLTVTGGNGPFAWSVASGTIPSGLGLGASSTAATTTIAGTPNATGTYQFVISVTNGATSTSAAYTVTIAAATSTCTSNCGGGHQNDADIAITKTVDNANPAGGGTVNYTITVTALGPATSSIVTAHDILPSGLSLNSATTSVGSYNMSTGDWTIGMLSPNATATLHIAATVDSRSAGQSIVNTATVSELSSLVDNPSNNSSSISIAVQPAGCTSNCGGGGGGCTSNCGGGGGGGGITVYPIVINVSSYASTTVGTTLTVPVTIIDQNGFKPVITSTSTGSAVFGTSTMNIVWTPNATGTITMTITASDPWTHTTKTVTLEALTSGGGGGGGGNVLGASTSTIGEILGESTACGFYITHYIHLNRQNNFADVVRLQAFLNKWMKADLPITGFYGQKTADAVDQFQVKFGTEVLAPWIPYGLPSDHTPTEYVYKTTRRWINMLECPALGLPIPPLP